VSFPAPDKKEFDFAPTEGELKRTALYGEHLKLTKKMVPFAGWEMPVWYTGIGDEHQAVRKAAGLFDIGHMGILEVSGADAANFLNLLSTNYVRLLDDGVGQYSYVLDPGGGVMDDVIVYRRSKERFMVVVNASNADKIEAWFRAVLSGGVIIDREYPYKEFKGSLTIRDMKDPASGAEQRVDMALQGPKSLSVLKKLSSTPELGRALEGLKKFHFTEGELAGVNAIISRTGYTGEEVGFELYVDPEDTPKLWKAILEVGRDYGVKPAGLGARDSTRTEAGFPLYGHELAGKHNISPIGAGYGAFVKFHKPYFIGRKALLKSERSRRMEVVRFQMGKGSRAIRPDDPVVSRKGVCVGAATSCVLVEGRQLGLAYVDRSSAQEGTPLAIFPLPRGSKNEGEKPKDQLAEGDKVTLPEEAVVLSRFMVQSMGVPTLE
jgi:glycine hydroxymethyltransferase